MRNTIVVMNAKGGVGKSTLLHILGALDRPTSGRVFFAGEDVFARSEAGLTRFRRQDVGFVFQFYNLLSEMTALENAMLPALLLRLPVQEARARAADALADVTTLAQYADWMKGMFTLVPDGDYDLKTFATDARMRSRATCSAPRSSPSYSSSNLPVIDGSAA